MINAFCTSTKRRIVYRWHNLNQEERYESLWRIMSVACLPCLPTDQHAIRFIPKENGVHSIDVRFNGSHVPGSPFKIRVGEPGQVGDPGMVSAFGPGLEGGTTGMLRNKHLLLKEVSDEIKNILMSSCLFPLSGVASEFVVNTCNAGSGALSVTIDGPSKVKMDCQDCPEGYKVSYTPMAPGNYLISIKYGGPQHIVGSPFKAKVSGGSMDHRAAHILCGYCGQCLKRASSHWSSLDPPFIGTEQPCATGTLLLPESSWKCKSCFVRQFGAKQKAHISLNLSAGPRLSGGHSLHETSSVLVETVSKTSVMGGAFASLPKFSSDASKVISRGAGLSKAFVGQKNTFTVDCSKAGEEQTHGQEGFVNGSFSPSLMSLLLTPQAPTCWWLAFTGQRRPARRCTSNTWATGCTMSPTPSKNKAATSSSSNGGTRTSPAVLSTSPSLKTELFIFMSISALQLLILILMHWRRKDYSLTVTQLLCYMPNISLCLNQQLCVCDHSFSQTGRCFSAVTSVCSAVCQNGFTVVAAEWCYTSLHHLL